jgi:hypothetical protein
MDIVTQVMQKVNEVFDEDYLEKIARDTGFMRRKRKVIPKQFLENMLLVMLESPANSYNDLVYEFNQNHQCVISKQGLHKRCHEGTLEFMKSVLNTLLAHTFSSVGHLGAIPFIQRVQVIDSTEIRLHEGLKALFPQVRNQGAAVKLQSLMDVVNKDILALEICPSKAPDQGYKNHIAHVQLNDLLIGDLGYFCVDTFREVTRRGGFFLSRHFKNTHVYQLNRQERIDLRKQLKQSQEDTVSLDIRLGGSQFPCRLVAIKLPEEAYQKRLKNLKEKHRKDPKMKKYEEDVFDHWTLLITNLPVSIQAETLLRLYSMRWQIELFYKMAKTFLKLKAIKETNRKRAMITLYTVLIAIVMLSFVATTIIDKEISLYKASKVFVKNIREFIGFINNKKTCAISWLRDLMGKFALKETRRNRPSTQQSLAWRPIYA